MAFPPEIIENILTHCSGKTLLSCRHVCREWQEMVDYISQKTRIWKWCCVEEIPQKELTQYLVHYNKDDSEIWFFIYKNWVTWQDIVDIDFEIILTPAEIPRITCIDVFEQYIAVGSEDGRVRIFDQLWRPLFIMRHQAEKVTKVGFLYNDSAVKIVSAYPKAVMVEDLEGEDFNNQPETEDAICHSIFKDHICYQGQGGRLTIKKLTNSERTLDDIWFTRVYSPKNITSINMWNGICTILVSNDVRKVNYEDTIVPTNNYSDKCLLTFSSIPNSMTSQQTHYILRDDIIIVFYRAENLVDKEYLEVIMLEGGTKYVKKLFNTTEVLEATITCICLYGNTLVLGVDTGIVYFYHVPSWKHFTIKEYGRRVIIGKHPITNIVVKETKLYRKFYITSSFNIHELVGFSANY